MKRGGSLSCRLAGYASLRIARSEKSDFSAPKRQSVETKSNSVHSERLSSLYSTVHDSVCCLGLVSFALVW